MNDKNTTLADIKEMVTEFADQRDWHQFHTPKNLVMALASEVGELSDIFRWETGDQSKQTAIDPQTSQAVASELADVMMFAVEFASVCEIDIASAIKAKMKLNAERYPVEKSKGSAKKHNQL